MLKIEDLNMPILPCVDNLERFEQEVERINSIESLQYELEAVTKERTDETHEKLRSLLANRIREYGYMPTSNQYIDLAAKIENIDYLFETKPLKSNVQDQIRKGICQLYEYRYFQHLPNARLVLVTDGPLTGINTWLPDFLKGDRGIYLIWKMDNENFLTTNEGAEILPFIKTNVESNESACP
jgi:hypothetical protein